MRKVLLGLFACCAFVYPAKAEEACAYRLTSFNGLSAPGTVQLQPWARPGDVLLSIVDTTGSAIDYTEGYFTPEIVEIPNPSTNIVVRGVQQSGATDLSALHFVALVCRRAVGVK